MDRQHTGGEIQRLGGVGTLQTPGDELVATRGTGLGLRWKPRGGTVNSTLGVGTVPSRSVRYRNRFARPLDRGTGAPTASARKKLVRKMALRLATPTPQTWTMDGGA